MVALVASQPALYKVSFCGNSMELWPLKLIQKRKLYIFASCTSVLPRQVHADYVCLAVPLLHAAVLLNRQVLVRQLYSSYCSSSFHMLWVFSMGEQGRERQEEGIEKCHTFCILCNFEVGHVGDCCSLVEPAGLSISWFFRSHIGTLWAISGNILVPVWPDIYLYIYI